MATLRGVMQPCPHCGAPQDSLSGAGHESAPKPGDLAMCFNCGRWLMLDSKLQRRLPDAKAQRFIRRSKACQRAERTWREYKLKNMSTDGPKN